MASSHTTRLLLIGRSDIRDPAHSVPVERGVPTPLAPAREQRSAAPQRALIADERAAGRERMLDELARRAAPRGFRIAYDLLRSRDQAEDAVQEALARACEHAERIRDADAASAWFYRVLTNICLRALRRRRLRRFILGDERATADAELGMADIAHAARADVELARGRELMRLFRALDALPAKQRIALLLRYGHDLPVAEIADMLNVRPATVKTHLVRGLERLRTLMEHES